MGNEMKKELKNIGDRNSDFSCMKFIKKLNGNVVLTSVSSEISDLVIPEGVNEIRPGCMAYSKKLKSVKFPDSLRIIDDDAFYRCKNLTSIEFGKGFYEIKEQAFMGCKSLESVDLINVSGICRLSFAMCENLRDVKLHEGLSYVKSDAFWKCQNLKRVVLPSSVEMLGNSCFDDSNEIFIAGNRIPDGILQSVDPFPCENNNLHLTIHIGGKTIVVPRVIIPGEKPSVELLLRNFNPEKDENVVLYNCAFDTDAPQKIALEGFPFSPKPETKNFLIKSFPGMIEKAKTEEDFRSVFSKFKNLKLLTYDLTDAALAVAQRKNWPRAAAFVLEETKEFSQNSLAHRIKYEFCL